MFRWLMLVVLGAAVGVSAAYRWRARRASGTIPRSREGRGLVALRSTSLMVPLTVLGYAIRPEWMQWASVSAPAWSRWLGVALGLLTVAGAWWVLSSIGANVSETIFTKPTHALVQTGPYRWIRHPLYTNGLLLLLAISLMMSSWLLLAMTILALLLMTLVVIPLEESHLRARFGAAYDAYAARTGRLLPRITRRPR